MNRFKQISAKFQMFLVTLGLPAWLVLVLKISGILLGILIGALLVLALVAFILMVALPYLFAETYDYEVQVVNETEFTISKLKLSSTRKKHSLTLAPNQTSETKILRGHSTNGNKALNCQVNVLKFAAEGFSVEDKEYAFLIDDDFSKEHINQIRIVKVKLTEEHPLPFHIVLQSGGSDEIHMSTLIKKKK